MLDLARIQAVTLDLDDTLWPIWPTIARAETALQDWLAAKAPGASALFADPARRLALRHRVMADQPDLLHDLSALRLASIRLGLLDCGEDEALAKPAFDVFFEARHQVVLFDDALPGLAVLARRFPIWATTPNSMCWAGWPPACRLSGSTAKTSCGRMNKSRMRLSPACLNSRPCSAENSFRHHSKENPWL